MTGLHWMNYQIEFIRFTIDVSVVCSSESILRGWIYLILNCGLLVTSISNNKTNEMPKFFMSFLLIIRSLRIMKTKKQELTETLRTLFRQMAHFWVVAVHQLVKASKKWTWQVLARPAMKWDGQRRLIDKYTLYARIDQVLIIFVYIYYKLEWFKLTIKHQLITISKWKLFEKNIAALRHITSQKNYDVRNNISSIHEPREQLK